MKATQQVSDGLGKPAQPTSDWGRGDRRPLLTLTARWHFPHCTPHPDLHPAGTPGAQRRGAAAGHSSNLETQATLGRPLGDRKHMPGNGLYMLAKQPQVRGQRETRVLPVQFLPEESLSLQHRVVGGRGDGRDQ